MEQDGDRGALLSAFLYSNPNLHPGRAPLLLEFCVLMKGFHSCCMPVGEFVGKC